MEPKLLNSVVTFDHETITPVRTISEYKTVLSMSEVEFLKESMLMTVDNGTGVNADVSGVDVGGKTGTAEVAAGEDPHAWFMGAVFDEEYPIAIALVLEGGGSGGSNAAPIAGDILEYAIDTLYDS